MSIGCKCTTYPSNKVGSLLVSTQRFSQRELIFYLFSSLLIVVFLIRVMTHQGLALDGSAGILGLVLSEEIQFIRGREFEEFLNQAPTVLLIKAGISSITYASYLLGITVFGIPTALWIYSLKLSMNSNLRFLLVLIAVLTQVLFSSNFFMPSMLANAVGLLIILLLTNVKNLSWPQIWLLMGLVTLAIRLYETMMLFSLLGILLSFFAMRRKVLIMPMKLQVIVMGGLVLSLLSSAHGLLYPVHKKNLESGIDLTTIMFHSPFLIFILIVLILMASLFIAIQFPNFMVLNLISGLVLSLCIVFVVTSEFQMGATSHWYLRSSVTLVVLMCGTLISVMHIFQIEAADVTPTPFPIFALVAVFTLIVSVNSALGWNKYLYLLENTVNRSPNVMEYGELHTPIEMDKTYSGSWSTTYLSVVLRHGPNSGIVQNAFPKQVPPDHNANNLILVLPIYDNSFPFWRQ
jgi:hypothetical protein